MTLGHSTHKDFLVRTHRTTRKALFVPDRRRPIPTDRLENYQKNHCLPARQNGNNEDFEDKYQELNKSQQKRVLQGPTWTGETWFRVKKGTILPGNRPPQPPAVTITNTQGTRSNVDISIVSTTTVDKTHLPRGPLKTHRNSTSKHPQQQHRFHIQKTFNQRRTIGLEKATCGKEYIFNHEWICTYRNKQTMDQTSQDWLNKEEPSSDLWTEQEDMQWKTTGQQRDKQHSTRNGQDQQTSKNVHSSRTSS